MDTVMVWAGNLAALVGVAICAIAGLTRLTGSFFMSGFAVGTLFLGGMALMVLACLIKLHLLAASR